MIQSSVVSAVPRTAKPTRKAEAQTEPEAIYTPVSYTHLDNTVAGDRTDDAADGTMDQSTDRNDDTVSGELGNSVKDLGEGVGNAVEAVSYTHLDVYKRQDYKVFKKIF